MLLQKGLEVEMFTGTPQGEIVGISDRIVNNLNCFKYEIDSRHVEYTTSPLRSYKELLADLLYPRVKLREYLKFIGNYTLIPGSTLSLSGSDRFFRSDPSNPYHSYVEQTYGTRLVTASVHINIGIDDPELLLRAYRLIRVEAPLYLALSASSPFLDGQLTGYHSTRWRIFPQVPTYVPLFESHAHFVDWTEAQLLAGTMQSVRHLWSSVRPNGDHRPHDLNRLELRICDLVTNPTLLLAITALLEARLLQLILDPTLDPLESSILPISTRATDLVALTNANEMAAAQTSLEATLRNWKDGRTILARDWIEQMYQEVCVIAEQRGFSCFLSPLKQILKKGNTAQRWLKLHDQGLTCQSILMEAIEAMANQEQEVASCIFITD